MREKSLEFIHQFHLFICLALISKCAAGFFFFLNASNGDKTSSFEDGVPLKKWQSNIQLYIVLFLN